MSDEDLARTPLDGGWAVKDHLTHITAWERMLAAHLRDGSYHDVVGMTPEQYATAELEHLNERIYQQHCDDDVTDVLGSFRRSPEALVAAIEPLSDADLAKPYWLDDPSRSVMRKISGDTYLHYAEHRAWIDEVAARLRSEEARTK